MTETPKQIIRMSYSSAAEKSGEIAKSNPHLTVKNQAKFGSEKGGSQNWARKGETTQSVSMLRDFDSRN